MFGNFSESTLLLNDLDKNKPNQENGTLKNNSGSSHKLRDIIRRNPSTFYKGKGYHGMSNAAFQTILDELAIQKNEAATMSRSYSDGQVQPTTEGIESRKNMIKRHGRRALYGALPMVSAFGMQHRESSLRSILTIASCDAIHDLMLAPDEYEV